MQIKNKTKFYFVAFQYFEYGVKQLGRHKTENIFFYIRPFEIVNFPF